MKNLWNLSWRVLAVTLVAWIGNSIAGAVLFAGIDVGWEVEPSPAVLLGTGLAATLLIASALVVPARRSALRGARLALALFLAIVGLNVVLLLVEGFVFLDRPASFFLRSGAVGIVQAALLAGMTTFLFGRGPAPARPTPSAAPSPSTTTGWFGRLAIAAASYVVLYLTAGMLIFPAVESFYATQDLSVGPWFIPLQLGRGTLYVLFTLLLIRSQVGSRRSVALRMAVLFPLLAGAANLLSPNPLQPDWVRPFHMIEIGWSNFVYGLLVGFLFWNPRAGAAEALRPAGDGEPEEASPRDVAASEAIAGAA